MKTPKLRRISSQARYDHFDNSPNMLTLRRSFAARLYHYNYIYGLCQDNLAIYQAAHFIFSGSDAALLPQSELAHFVAQAAKILERIGLLRRVAKQSRRMKRTHKQQIALFKPVAVLLCNAKFG